MHRGQNTAVCLSPLNYQFCHSSPMNPPTFCGYPTPWHPSSNLLFWKNLWSSLLEQLFGAISFLKFSSSFSTCAQLDHWGFSGHTILPGSGYHTTYLNLFTKHIKYSLKISKYVRDWDYWLNFGVENDEEGTVQTRQWYLRIKIVI